MSLASQRYSHYLPVWEAQAAKSHRKSSIAKTTDTRSKDKERAARNAAAAADSAKRRSTMNSRANYDEEEVLRKVLEESKHDAPGTTDSSSRRGKRVREDSEEYVGFCPRGIGTSANSFQQQANTETTAYTIKFTIVPND